MALAQAKRNEVQSLSRNLKQMRPLSILAITMLPVAGAFAFDVLQNSSHKSEKVNGASPDFALIPKTGLPNLDQPSDGIFSGDSQMEKLGLSRLRILELKLSSL